MPLRRRDLSEEERKLWESFGRKLDCTYVPQTRPAQGKRVREPVRHRSAPALRTRVALDPPGPARILRQGQVRLRREARRQDFRQSDVIDLHGLRLEVAIRRLETFLHTAVERRCHLVLVITGKGRVSGSASVADRPIWPTGVIARGVRALCASASMRPLIVAWEEAASHHGGLGALYVWLRKPKGAQSKRK